MSQKVHRRGRSSTSSLGSRLGISIHSALLATERNIALVELQHAGCAEHLFWCNSDFEVAGGVLSARPQRR